MSELMGPGAWDRIWAPHRKEYLQQDAGNYTSDNCPFCVALTTDDVTGLVVVRDTHAYVVMNKYPYNSGHVLVCTNRHVASYDELEPREVEQIARLTQEAMRTLRHVSGAHGFNIGMNQGDVAGAGVAGHLHQHVVPRWAHDSNFMPIIGGTKVMSALVSDTRQVLSEFWQTSD